jgi:hypothetical protein
MRRDAKLPTDVPPPENRENRGQETKKEPGQKCRTLRCLGKIKEVLEPCGFCAFSWRQK